MADTEVDWTSSTPMWKPIIVNTMKQCCYDTIEGYLKHGGDETDGLVIKCIQHPTNSDHRVSLTNGKWRGRVAVKKPQ